MRTFSVILAIIVIVITGLLIKRKGDFFSSQEASGNINTKFTPEEWATIAKKNSIDFLAGECASKTFVMFKKGSPSQSEVYFNTYTFYNIGKNPEWEAEYQDECEKKNA